MPAISASASVGADGRLHLTLSNANPHDDLPVSLRVRGMAGSAVSGRVLQGDAMDAHNTFDRPNAVRPSEFTGATLNADGLEVQLPKMSVVALEIA